MPVQLKNICSVHLSAVDGTRGVRKVVKCRPGTRINFERVPGYPLKLYILFLYCAKVMISITTTS